MYRDAIGGQDPREFCLDAAEVLHVFEDVL